MTNHDCLRPSPTVALDGGRHSQPRLSPTVSHHPLTGVGTETVVVAAGTTWRLEHRARPWTANAERRMHPHERADLVGQWRHAFAILARAAHVPHLDRVVVTAMPVLRNRRSRPDTGACFPAVKAAVDGLVDPGANSTDT